ncbi:aminoacyl-tRNA hydrolase [Boudabousia liubingyangii]|uniref:Peptidyl-tRNA hydrolase n=1 Tax=Boudabousia liubingyangii TaxID=1921764 RepID=A0A1Q5PJS3_9ACTO|nr:aminoacyl-tRNA hydrolase [Boudabousia liubingyangii]OKL46192.1 aminoacyl-tRNA hydrolase [Boudabousia liubingyangii]OKL46341.1 aminoacyl-tRNA hydrolase [Boudabousia liubingyangii]
MSDSPWLIIGLGNPGNQYRLNRHNLGHMVADALADEMNTSFTRHKARAQVAAGRLGFLPGGIPGPAVSVAKLDSFMNVSGGPTKALVDFYGVDPDHLLVIHDELDIPPHELRLKKGGGEGGHNGLRSITSALGTKDYLRLRVGIGRPPGRMDTADFVLGDLPGKERPEWATTIAQAAEAAADVVLKGFLTAQQDLHARA